LRWNPFAQRCEWLLAGNDLATGFDIETMVLLSLFTDARATPDWVPPGGSSNDPRGWWGDFFATVGPLGSNLWQLDRSKIGNPQALLNQATDYCTAALQWLIDQGLAASVTVQCRTLPGDQIGIAIAVTQPSGTPLNFQYQWAWQQ
jgi:phage gp46-like protein